MKLLKAGGNARGKLGVFLSAAAVLCIATTASADTDICGNEIRTYTEDGVSKTYQFIVSGDPRPESVSSADSQSTMSDAATLDARFRTWLESLECHFREFGFFLIFR